jgi:hypothetical protein
MNPTLTIVWAVSQATAIESAGGVLLVESIESFKGKDKAKGYLYVALSSLLALVGGVMLFLQLSNFEQQGDTPFMFVLYALRCICSVGFIYLCRTKHIRFTSIASQENILANEPHFQQPQLSKEDILQIIAENLKQPELDMEAIENQIRSAVCDVLSSMAVNYTKVEEVQEERKPISISTRRKASTEDKLEKVREYLEQNPSAKVREVASALEISPSNAHGYIKKCRGEAD